MMRLSLRSHTTRGTSLVAAALTAHTNATQQRSYATAQQSTRSCAKTRRYYTDPLRAPQTGVRTVVGRLACEGGTPATAPSAMDAPELNTTTRCLTTRPTPKTQLMRILSAHGRTVRYDDDGVPIEGSFHLLPWREQLRILAAILGAFVMTKAFFDVVRFELLYYGVWKLGYRNDDSFTKRVLYYGSTALLAAGLLFSFNLNFFLSAWVVGRREIAAHMMCNGVAHVMPQRAVLLIERRLKLSFV